MPLGKLYTDKKQYDKAIILYKQAIEFGNVEAIFRLGRLYHVIMDYDNAIVYYKQAIEFNDNSSMNNLGSIYYNKEDHVNAIFYFKLAIKHGNVLAMENLATVYEKGQKDYAQAEYYYTLACMNGQKESIGRLLKIYNNANKYEEAFILIHKFDPNNILEALNKLTFPISSKNKMIIYPILERIEIPPGKTISTNIIPIMQDLAFYRQKLLCQLAYHYKNQNK